MYRSNIGPGFACRRKYGRLLTCQGLRNIAALEFAEDTIGSTR
jgi:hypothetical protein